MSDNAPEPLWLQTLRAHAAVHGQEATGARIGYTASVVSSALKGSYKGDLKRVQAAVEGALLKATVDCPVVGDLQRDRCVENQRRPFAATNPARIAFANHCPKCPHRSNQ